MLEGIIGKQNFEIARDKIGEILLLELTNQKNLQGFEEDVNIYQSRTSPINNSEQLMINVSLESADYSEKNQRDTSGKTMYTIDIYTTGIGNQSYDGSRDSSNRCHKFLGMIRYILSHTTYRTLTMPLGSVGGTKVESFVVMESDLRQDSNFVVMARLLFSVRLDESQSLETGIPFEGNESKFKLEQTYLGYIYKFTNQN